MKYILITLLIFSACSFDDIEDFINNDDEVVEVEATPEACPNPLVDGVQIFGNGGNLWKPIGDGGGANYFGNPVALFDPMFTSRFDSCEVTLKNGSTFDLRCIDDAPWTMIPFSCFANGNRQHFRSAFSCEEIAEIKVVCKDACQTVTFQAAGDACERVG